jgi:hypothetical protein
MRKKTRLLKISSQVLIINEKAEIEAIKRSLKKLINYFDTTH